MIQTISGQTTSRSAATIILVGALAGVALFPPLLAAQQPDVSQETRNFMRAKLQHSQKIIEGLSTDNFDMIAKSAQELSLLSLESQWNVIRTQRYIDESAEFRRSIERLVDATRSKRIDSAALGYVDVTLKCIHCHTYVRNQGAREGVGQNRPTAEPLPVRSVQVAAESAP